MSLFARNAIAAATGVLQATPNALISFGAPDACLAVKSRENRPNLQLPKLNVGGSIPPPAAPIGSSAWTSGRKNPSRARRGQHLGQMPPAAPEQLIQDAGAFCIEVRRHLIDESHAPVHLHRDRGVFHGRFAADVHAAARQRQRADSPARRARGARAPQCSGPDPGDPLSGREPAPSRRRRDWALESKSLRAGSLEGIKKALNQDVGA